MHTSRYQIVVSGRLGVAGREAFRNFHIEPHGMETALTGDRNRSGLVDVLTRMRDGWNWSGFPAWLPDTRLAQ